MIRLTLPLPPTWNHAYGQRRGGGKYLKPAGQLFRAQVQDIVAAAGHAKLSGRLSLFAAIYPKDRRRQDLDNRAKMLCDALTHAGVYLDDEQIDDLHLVRRPVTPGGKVEVVIVEISESA